MPPLLYFLGGLLAGWAARSWAADRSERTRWLAAAMRGETQRILDGVSRLHMTGALSNMDGLKLRHGSPENNVQLLVGRTRTLRETVDPYAGLGGADDNLDLYS